MAPRYRKIADLLRDNEVTAIIVDSDGNIEELIPIWLDCGINAIYSRKRGNDTISYNSLRTRRFYRRLNQNKLS